MKLKALTLNKGLIKTNLKRFWWMAALMTIYVFLMLPYGVFNQIKYYMPHDMGEPLEYIKIFQNMLEGHGAIYGIAFPIIAGMFILNYLNRVNSVSMYHCLPFTRESFYLNGFVSGLIIIAIPMIINALLLFAIMPFSGVAAPYDALDVLKVCGHYFLFSYLQLAICFLVGMFTGNFFAHGAFTVILNFLPIILYYFITAVLEIFLRGFAGESDQVYDKLLNLPAMKVFDPFDITPLAVLIYIVSFIIIVFLGIIFYKKRPLEGAGDVIVFKFLKPVFKYGFTFCTMIGGYLLLAHGRGHSGGILIAALFAVIGFAAAEMLLTKSLKFWKNYKGFFVYALICVIMAGVLAADPMGFTNYVPKADEIEKAYVNFDMNSPNVFKNAVGLSEEKIHYYHGNDGAVFEDSTGIEKVIKLHNAAISVPKGQYNDHISVGYVLKNGKTVFRHFEMDKNQFKPFVDDATKNEKYFAAKYPQLKAERDAVVAVRVNIYGQDDEFMIHDKEDISALLDAMIYDRASLGEAEDYGQHQGYIQLIGSDEKSEWYDYDLTEKMPKTYEVLENIKKTLDKE